MKRLMITEEDEFCTSNISGDINSVISFLNEMKSNGYERFYIDTNDGVGYQIAVFERSRPETDKEFEARKKQKAKDRIQNQLDKKVKELRKQVEAEFKERLEKL